jgi:integrase
MPANVIPRGERFAARLTVAGRQKWLGTRDTREEALQLVQDAREGHVPAPSRRPRAPRRRPPSIAVCEELVGRLPSRELQVFGMVALWSGLRLFEVAALELPDVAWELDGGAVLHVRHGKGPKETGGKEGWSVLLPRGADPLRAYVHAHRPAPGRVILRNQAGNPFTRKVVNRAWVKARGELEVTFHALRKAHATWLLDHGASDLDVAIQLRHIDREGRPDPELVRSVYGFPAVDQALNRIRGLG